MSARQLSLGQGYSYPRTLQGDGLGSPPLHVRKREPLLHTLEYSYMANPGPPLIVFALCKSKAFQVSTSSICVLINHHSPCTLLPARLDYLCTHRDGFVLMHMTLPLASYPVGTTNKHCVYAFIVTSSDPNQSTLPFLYRTIYHHEHAPSILSC